MQWCPKTDKYEVSRWSRWSKWSKWSKWPWWSMWSRRSEWSRWLECSGGPSGPGDPCCPSVQCGQDDQLRQYAFRRYMVFIILIIKISRKVEMPRLWQRTENRGKESSILIDQKPQNMAIRKTIFIHHHHCNCKGGLPVPKVKGYTTYYHHHGRPISMRENICLKSPLWKATFCFACLALQALTCNLILDKTKTPWPPGHHFSKM